MKTFTSLSIALGVFLAVGLNGQETTKVIEGTGPNEEVSAKVQPGGGVVFFVEGESVGSSAVDEGSEETTIDLGEISDSEKESLRASLETAFAGLQNDDSVSEDDRIAIAKFLLSFSTELGYGELFIRELEDSIPTPVAPIIPGTEDDEEETRVTSPTEIPDPVQVTDPVVVNTGYAAP